MSVLLMAECSCQPLGALIVVIAVLLLALPGGAPGAAPAQRGTPQSGTVVSLDGEGWLLAVDPGNVGLEDRWFDQRARETGPTRVSGVIDDVFPGYHGLVWYYRDFTAPANPDAQGRYLLRFWNADWPSGKYSLVATIERGGADAFRELAAHIARGSVAVFLSPGAFAGGDRRAAFGPLANKGALANLASCVYHKDEWAKRPCFRRPAVRADRLHSLPRDNREPLLDGAGRARGGGGRGHPRIARVRVGSDGGGAQAGRGPLCAQQPADQRDSRQEPGRRAALEEYVQLCGARVRDAAGRAEAGSCRNTGSEAGAGDVKGAVAR